jgi:hypothetical protein
VALSLLGGSSELCFLTPPDLQVPLGRVLTKLSFWRDFCSGGKVSPAVGKPRRKDRQFVAGRDLWDLAATMAIARKQGKLGPNYRWIADETGQGTELIGV